MDAANFVWLREGGGLTKLWQCQLKHLNVKSVYALQNMVMDMNLGKTSHPTSILVCKVCTKDKQYATKLDNDVERLAMKPLIIVHSSVCGPMRKK